METIFYKNESVIRGAVLNRFENLHMLLLLVFVAILSIVVSLWISCGELTPHAPISIESDEDFTWANGVVRGSGTLENPYVIEGWLIENSDNYGIIIKNTRKHFVIVNCNIENNCYGVYLENVQNGKIEQVVVRRSRGYGLRLEDSENNVIINCTFENAYMSIHGSNNMIFNNLCYDDSYGIGLFGSFNVVSGNIGRGNIYGISINGENNLISNNTWTESTYGITFGYSSTNNTLENNICENNKFNFQFSSFNLSSFMQNIAPSNLVDGKPVIYLRNKNNVVINQENLVGYLILVNCENFHISDLVLSHNDAGIYLLNMRNGLVENNLLENNVIGIHVEDSENIIFANNTLENNEGPGFWLSKLDNSLLEHNTCSNNGWGILNFYSDNNTYLHNTCENNMTGFFLEAPRNARLENNSFNNNKANFSISNIGLSKSNYLIDRSNLVNGKPIIYLVGENNIVINQENEIGYLALINCENVLVENLVLENNSTGIFAYYIKHSKIRNNTFRNNGYGIYIQSSYFNQIENNICENNYWGLYVESSDWNSFTNNYCRFNSGFGISVRSSDNNTFYYNLCENTGFYGIQLQYPSDNNIFMGNICENNEYGVWGDFNNSNLFYLNIFVNNQTNASDYGNNNWDNGSVGNCWDNYTGIDNDNDGIGDTPHTVWDDIQDRFPLMGVCNSRPTLITPENNATVNKVPTLKWTPVVDYLYPPVTYQINVSTTPDFETAFEVTSESTTYVLENLSDTQYYWRVAAVNSIGMQSEWSDIFSFTLSTVS